MSEGHSKVLPPPRTSKGSSPCPTGFFVSLYAPFVPAYGAGIHARSFRCALAEFGRPSLAERDRTTEERDRSGAVAPGRQPGPWRRRPAATPDQDGGPRRRRPPSAGQRLCRAGKGPVREARDQDLSPPAGQRPIILDMHVVVCVKQIPDPAEPGQLDPSTKTLKRDVKLILDESDSYGVEMALQLVDKAGGGSVSLVSMAPNKETSGSAHRARHGRGRRHPGLRPRPPGLLGPVARPRCWPRPSAARAPT